MAWTTPKTNWAVGELVTAEDMNAVGENLATLKDPATAAYTTTADITENSNNPAEFIDVDSDNLNLTITTAGGDVLVHFQGSVERSGGDRTCRFDIDVDGNRQGGDKGIISTRPTYDRSVSFTHLIQNLTAGAHTFKLQWKDRGIKLLAGAQFWVREI